MAIGAGFHPGIIPLLGPVGLDVLADPRHEGIVRPPHLPHDVMGNLPLILHMAVLAGGSRFRPFDHGFFNRNVEVPMLFIPLILQPMLGQVIGFPIVMVGPAVALRTDFRLAGLRYGEFVPRVAGITLVLIDVAAGAAVGDFPLRHPGIDFNFHIGPVIQGMRRTPLGPLIFRPRDRIALGFALGKFL